jgi:hypothetical protein
LDKNLLFKINSVGDTIFEKYIEREKCDPSCSGYYDFQTDNNGNYIFVGEYLAKFNNNLDAIWTEQLNGKGKSIVIDNENNCLIFGQTGQYNSSNYYLCKIDDSGNLLWEKSYNYGQNDFGEHIEKTLDGGFILIGTSEQVTSDKETLDVIKIIKVDKDGNVLWDKEYNYGSMNENRGFSIKQLDTDQYIVLGISDFSTVLFKITIK